jgi:hypothetical protein
MQTALGGPSRREIRRSDVSRFASRALEVWVQALQPIPAHPAPIAAAGALRHDPLEAQFARLGEHERRGVARMGARRYKCDAASPSTIGRLEHAAEAHVGARVTQILSSADRYPRFAGEVDYFKSP